MRSLPQLFPRDSGLFEVLLLALICLALPSSARSQGSGRDVTGTGGNHVIVGKIYFPSGRKAEGTIQIKLQTYGAGELSTLADSGGSFTFTSLSPGNYTVVVNAGDDYEIAREAVTIDSDLSLPRSGTPINPGSRAYTVMVTLQTKANNHAKASVVNAALAEVPPDARTLYEKAVELAKTNDSLKAIENLKSALSLFPKFPLALNELGVQYLKIGQASNAVEPLKSATALSPDAAAPKLNLGIALLEINQYRDAEAQLRGAVRIASTPTTHMYLGLALYHLKNNVEAEKELKAAIDLSDNKLPIAHYYLGGLYWKMGEALNPDLDHDRQLLYYRRAADELETYLRLTPNAPDTERVRGTIRQLRAKP
ncbi:MAG TPA: tetratricopeptide repeat protein [Pyrinomonadaceae bacterium]|nr:tetratricopeptide repeat protein [Pyrinomonadaceae bacterium]